MKIDTGVLFNQTGRQGGLDGAREEEMDGWEEEGEGEEGCRRGRGYIYGGGPRHGSGTEAGGGFACVKDGITGWTRAGLGRERRTRA